MTVDAQHKHRRIESGNPLTRSRKKRVSVEIRFVQPCDGSHFLMHSGTGRQLSKEILS